jgi:hypothetical protein
LPYTLSVSKTLHELVKECNLLLHGSCPGIRPAELIESINKLGILVFVDSLIDGKIRCNLKEE